MYAWGLGVIVPHLFAMTKTPSATVLAMPPLLLLLGYLISEAWRGERWPLAALVGVLIMSLAMPAVIRRHGYGYPNSRAFGTLMLQATWVLYHVIAGARWRLWEPSLRFGFPSGKYMPSQRWPLWSRCADRRHLVFVWAC